MSKIDQETWQCWNLDCVMRNRRDEDVCLSCGNPKGYQSPEVKLLVLKAKKEEDRYIARCMDVIYL